MKTLKILFSLFFYLFLITCCKSSKHVESKTEKVSSIQKQEEKAANIRESATVSGNEKTQVNEDILIYRREYYPPVPGDTLPAPLKSEEWRGITKKREQNKETGSETNIGIEAASKSAENADISINNTTKETEKSDTRPIQGFEWVWVFVGIGIMVVSFIIVFFANKKLPKGILGFLFEKIKLLW
jgi:Ca2+/Na+ antiporter